MQRNPFLDYTITHEVFIAVALQLSLEKEYMTTNECERILHMIQDPCPFEYHKLGANNLTRSLGAK